ncbi:MAG: 30S ribosome-binding factor RbfA [Bacteroidota bacterium]
MDTLRTLKYGKLIQKELGEIFTLEGKNWYGNHFVTITGVTVTTDLSKARVRISVFKSPKPEAVIKSLQIHTSEIRKSLGSRIRNQARIIPTLEFFLDDSLDYVEKMENVFKNIQIPPSEEEGEAK